MSNTSSAPKKARSSGSKIPTTLLVTVIPVTVALNIVGGIIASALRLPVYLDMIGTAVAAIVLGPWWGALVGLLTNSGSALISGPTSLPFALVNIVGALIWGYGVRSSSYSVEQLVQVLTLSPRPSSQLGKELLARCSRPTS